MAVIFPLKMASSFSSFLTALLSYSVLTACKHVSLSAYSLFSANDARNFKLEISLFSAQFIPISLGLTPSSIGVGYLLLAKLPMEATVGIA